MRAYVPCEWGPARIHTIEILTDEGVTGFAANYGGGEAACLVIAKHFKRFLIGEDPFNIEKLWDQMYR